MIYVPDTLIAALIVEKAERVIFDQIDDGVYHKEAYKDQQLLKDEARAAIDVLVWEYGENNQTLKQQLNYITEQFLNGAYQKEGEAK